MALGPIGQLHISVTDVDASVRFYRDVLGVPFLFRVPGQPMAFFQSGDVRLYLGVPESAQFASRVTAYFTVDDVEAEHARLINEGVSFGSEPHLVHRDEGGELWMAGFTDPDGNNLIIMQQRASTPPGETAATAE